MALASPYGPAFDLKVQKKLSFNCGFRKKNHKHGNAHGDNGDNMVYIENVVYLGK
jgi:hypothetical protein